MALTKHPIWEVFPDADTIENFEKKILQPFFLKNEVPADVKSQANISGKLLIHSFYEYEFIDVALTQAVFTFEKALRIKWNEIHNKPTNLRLVELIDWFHNGNYFETRNNTLPHQLRIIRNGKVHEETKSLGGITFIQKVYETFDLINDIYEDPQLRLARKNESLNLTEQLIELTQQGMIFSFHRNRLLLFGFYPVFINNKIQPKTLTLLAYPIFDLSKFEKGEHFIPPHFTITVVDWHCSPSGFYGIDATSGDLVTLSIIEDEVNFKRIEEWHSRFYKIDNWALIDFIVSEPIENLFLKELRNFHRK